MLAAVFHGGGSWSLSERPQPVVEAADDVVIEVEACGICGTDLQILADPPGHPARPGVVLGHEFVGRVVASGPGAQDLQPGQRVVVDPDPKCGRCSACRSGRPASCERIEALGVVRDGALARWTKAPASAVYPLAEDPPAEVAALVEPLACVVNGVNRATPRPGESALVLGGGAIGCLFTALLRAAGAWPVVVVEPLAGRRTVARAVGASAVISPDELATARHELLPDGADIVVDAVGTQFAVATEHAALGGRIVLFGQNSNAHPPIHQYTITERSLTVFGSYITAYTFPPAIRLVEQGRLPLAPIVTHRLPLTRLAEGLTLLRSGEATKVVIVP
jgi:threonine dehydrogenase-like Zn-dependent dehydrogenase